MPLSSHHIFAFLNYVRVALTSAKRKVSAAKTILRVSKRVSRRGLLLLRFVVALNAAAEGIFVLSSQDHETASSWCLGGLAIVTGGSILV